MTAADGSVTWTLEDGTRELDETAARAALAAALAHGGEPELAVDLVFVDDAALARMHGEFLGDPTETDVITFDLRGDDPETLGGPGGEIYISVERARAVSASRGVPARRELALYVVHGALHLVGFDDHEPADREAMRAAEAAVMALLGFAPDDAPHEI